MDGTVMMEQLYVLKIEGVTGAGSSDSLGMNGCCWKYVIAEVLR